MPVRKTVILYLLGTFLLSYSLWGIIIIAQHFGYLAFGTPIMVALWLTAGMAPGIVSFFVLKRAGKVTLKSFLKDIFYVKQRWIHYLMVAAFLCLFFGIPALFADPSAGDPWYIAIAMIPMMIIGGGLEEPGWRLILQPALERRMSFTLASCITAIVWLVWHIPLFFIVGTTQQADMSFLVFSIGIFGMSFALAAIFRISKSIWMCVLFHAMSNALSASLPVTNRWESALAMSLAMIALSMAFVTINNRRKRGAPRSKENA